MNTYLNANAIIDGSITQGKLDQLDANSIYMSNGSTVEAAINDMSDYASEDYVNTAITNAITTTLNTAV